ncbi:glycosyltransferase family 4 protein [Actinomadura flavalba]|uniref:glycosyltransferase family 4 protein n=1 Tax=Actinomadura flavalba TaxID=1120938 RepID=UPI001F0A086F|nr:glycosyltransferase family 4 protein [Actinomadura flavalba]
MYGLWDQGHRDDALAALARAAGGARPRRLRRLAGFAVAVERPDAATPLLGALPSTDPVRPYLEALLAAKEGRLHAAERTAAQAPTRAARRLHRDLSGRLDALTWTPPRDTTDRDRTTDTRTSSQTRKRIATSQNFDDGSSLAAARAARATERDSVDNFPKESSGDPARVLHVVTNALPTTNAGYTVRTHRLATAQRAQGLDPHVVTRLGFPVAQGARDPLARRQVDGVPYHRLIPWRLPRTAREALDANVDAASELVGALRPSVLHAASNHVNAQIALALRERHGLPVVYEVRGFLEESWLSRDASRDTERDFYRLSRDLETACMRAADLVVTLGTTMRDEIVARGVPAEQVLVLPNGVDDAFLQPLPDASALRADLGIGPDEKVVGTTTSFYGYEGLDTLLDAGALLRDRGRPVRLLLVGDGPERPALRRRADDLGLGGLALFPGRVPADDVRKYHALLDAFVVPRRDERVCRLVTPLKPLEAMAGGVPVIASDLPALREIVRPEITGTLTFPNNPDDLANTILQTLYSPETRQMQGAARAWVHEERTWAAGTALLRDAYRTLGVPC